MDTTYYNKQFHAHLNRRTYMKSDDLSTKKFKIYLTNIHVTTHRRWSLGYASKCARKIYKTEENIHIRQGLDNLATTTT